MNIDELKKIVRGNGFQESHGSTTIVIDVETVVDLLDELKQFITKAIQDRDKEVINKIVELRDLRENEKGKSLDYWEGYTTAITNLLKELK